jgi:hypothetical protein
MERIEIPFPDPSAGIRPPQQIGRVQTAGIQRHSVPARGDGGGGKRDSVRLPQKDLFLGEQSEERTADSAEAQEKQLEGLHGSMRTRNEG